MDDYGVDLAEITRVIERAEVLVVRFQVVQKRLLIDFRSAQSDGPLIKAVAPASSVEERFRSLKALRPNFPLPDRIMSFLWPRSVTAMDDAGILASIRDRLLATDSALEPQIAQAFAEAVQEERATLSAAVRGGEGFQTIWERDPS